MSSRPSPVSSWIAVGSHGTIIRTRDNGAHWQAQVSGVERELTSVSFADTLNGWIGTETEPTALTQWRTGPGRVLHTTNGGRTWAAQSIGEPLTTSTPQVSAVSPTEAVVVYQWMQRRPPNYFIVPPLIRMRRTTNGGRTWSAPVSVPSYQPGVSYSIFAGSKFFTPLTGYVLSWDPGGYGSILTKTTNGGVTWTTVRPDTLNNFQARAFSFQDARHGWVVGDSQFGQDEVFRTADGGQTWTAVSTANTGVNQLGFWGVAFADSLHGVIRDYAQTVTYYATSDGGQTWQTSFEPAGRDS